MANRIKQDATFQLAGWDTPSTMSSTAASKQSSQLQATTKPIAVTATASIFDISLTSGLPCDFGSLVIAITPTPARRLTTIANMTRPLTAAPGYKVSKKVHSPQ